MKFRLFGRELSFGRPRPTAADKNLFHKTPDHPLSPLDIIQGLDEGLLAVDKSRRVLLANDALAPLLNRSPRETVGRPIWEVLRHREISEMTESVLAGGGQETRDVSFPLPEESTWRVHARPLEEGAVLTFLDLTQIRRLENIRKDFVANVSHELKTPLTSLRAALETLLDGALEDPAHAREFIVVAHDQVERLHRLIEDLLALSRLEKDREKAASGDSSLPAVAREVLAALAPLAKKAEVSLSLDLEESLPRLPLPKDQLTQLLMNLLDNGVKFNRSGGSVSLSARKSGAAVLLSVRDTGVGIPPQDIPRIFERFYRVEKSRGRDVGGTGLGLAIVKHIAENAGGSVRVESSFGDGSTFTVTLPL